MVNKQQLEALMNVDITTTDKGTLFDITAAKIDVSLPANVRVLRFCEQTKNPYCFLCGDTPVKVRFVSENKTLTQSLGHYFKSLK